MYSNPSMNYPYLTPSSHQWSIPPTYPTNPSFTTPTTPSFPSLPWELFSPYYTNPYIPTTSPNLYPNHGYSPHIHYSFSSYSTTHHSIYYTNCHQQLKPSNTYTFFHKYQSHPSIRRDCKKYLQVSLPRFKKRSFQNHGKNLSRLFSQNQKKMMSDSSLSNKSSNFFRTFASAGQLIRKTQPGHRAALSPSVNRFDDTEISISIFDGKEDAYWWVLCAEKIFKDHGIPDTMKLQEAVKKLHGDAHQWWLWRTQHQPLLCWDTFTTIFLWHFKPEWRSILPIDEEEEHALELQRSAELDDGSILSIEDEKEDRVLELHQLMGNLIFPNSHYHEFCSTLTPEMTTSNSFSVLLSSEAPFNDIEFDDKVDFAIQPKPPDPTFDINNSITPPQLTSEHNFLSDEVPETVYGLQNLTRFAEFSLRRAYNNFSSEISSIFNKLSHLDTLSVEQKRLSASVPDLNGSTLHVLNVSFNNLTWPIPSRFSHLDISVFLGNELCRSPLQIPCPGNNDRNKKNGLSQICSSLKAIDENDDRNRLGYSKGLLRFLRRDVFKQVCKLNTVSKDLVLIFEHYHEDCRMLLNAVKILVFLIMPIEPGSTDVSQQLESLWHLQSAVTNSDVAIVIVPILEKPVENLELNKFTEDDWKLIQVDNLLLLEIFHYIFMGQEPELIVGGYSKGLKVEEDSQASLDSLQSIMEEEKKKRIINKLGNFSRHSQFSGTFARVTMDGSKAVFKGNPNSSCNMHLKSQNVIRGVNRFLSEGYNVMIRSFSEDFVKEHPSAQKNDTVVFFQVADCISSFQFDKYSNSKEEKKDIIGDNDAAASNVSGKICGQIEASLHESMFQLVISQWRHAYDGLKETNDYNFISAAGCLKHAAHVCLFSASGAVNFQSKDYQTSVELFEKSILYIPHGNNISGWVLFVMIVPFKQWDPGVILEP